MTELIEVTTTCASRDAARLLARQLVEERLAACVQVSGPIESVYRWQGEIKSDQEWVCTIKTLTQSMDRLIEFISAHHDYDVPQILIHPILVSSVPYEEWVRAEAESK